MKQNRQIKALKDTLLELVDIQGKYAKKKKK